MIWAMYTVFINLCKFEYSSVQSFCEISGRKVHGVGHTVQSTVFNAKDFFVRSTQHYRGHPNSFDLTASQPSYSQYRLVHAHCIQSISLHHTEWTKVPACPTLFQRALIMCISGGSNPSHCSLRSVTYPLCCHHS